MTWSVIVLLREQVYRPINVKRLLAFNPTNITVAQIILNIVLQQDPETASPFLYSYRKEKWRREINSQSNYKYTSA